MRPMPDGPGVVIVDFGMGNLGSIRNMLRYIDVPSTVTARPEDVAGARKLILAGVGAFDTAMRNLEMLGLVPVLRERVLEQGVPVLGICLGMQLFARSSEEGRLPGLGWLDGEVVRFDFRDLSPRPKVPQMGWNLVRPVRESALFAGNRDDRKFYFVHSYHMRCPPEIVLCRTAYGYDFVSGVEQGKIFGVQFHPEKSHRFGMDLLRNFAALPAPPRR